jgi:hypothetical protein
MPYRQMIESHAETFGLQAVLVEALIRVESGYTPWAWNPEPRYRYFWNVRLRKPFRAITTEELTAKFPPKDFRSLAGDADQEWWAQQASWGLMQVMGALAREVGYLGPYLTALCDPDMNLRLGCEHLARLLAWAGGDDEQALAAYNGGKGGNSQRPFRNAGYAAKVLAARTTLINERAV